MDLYTHIFLTQALPVNVALLLIICLRMVLTKKFNKTQTLSRFLFVVWTCWMLSLGLFLGLGVYTLGWIKLTVWTASSLVTLTASWYMAKASWKDMESGVPNHVNAFFSFLVALIPYTALNAIIIHILIINTSILAN